MHLVLTKFRLGIDINVILQARSKELYEDESC